MTFENKKCTPCQGGVPPLTKSQIIPLFEDLDLGWEIVNEKKIEKTYTFSTYSDAISFVNKLADLAEKEGHHPYIHINYKKVKVILFTHKINGLHDNDFILASKCDLLVL